jgi:hypothetical protein
MTPLKRLAMRGCCSEDALAALRTLLAAAGDAAALCARDCLGFTAWAYACRQPRTSAAALEALRAAYDAAGLQELLREDSAAVATLALIDACGDAIRAVVARALPAAQSAAAEEQACLRALLQAAGMAGTRSLACEAEANPYATLHAFLMARLPAACAALYDAPPAEGSLACGVLHLCTDDNIAAPLLARWGAERRLVWADMELWQLRVQQPVRHGFGYAVPTEEALAALAALSPLLEIGAGVGYWAALLRGRGADVLATDAAPPDATALSNGPPHGQHWHRTCQNHVLRYRNTHEGLGKRSCEVL